MFAQHGVGQPRIVGAEGGAKGFEQRHQRAGDVAKADDAHCRAEQRRHAGIAAPAIGFVPASERPVGACDPAHQVERHGQRELRHRPREHWRCTSHANAARKARGVIHVREKIALDVKDGLEPWRTLEPLRR